MQHLLHREELFDYVHQELALSFTEREIFLREKKVSISLGVGPPWRVGPVDLVTPVSMVV